MGYYEAINVNITGQVKGNDPSQTKRMVVAKLEMVCAEFGLDLEENPEKSTD